MLPLTSLTATLLALQVSAHGGCLNYTVGDTWYPGYAPFDDQPSQDASPSIVQRKWKTNNPILDPTSSFLPCNTPGTPARASIPILPGQPLSAVYMYWVHTVGPMIVWMAHCPLDNCTSTPPSSLRWFKIAERGLLDGTIELGNWFQKTFSNWDGSPSLWTETIPPDLKKGAYLVRHEIISLHSANRPQFYAECAHLEVGGVGVGEPGEEFLVGIPGVWSLEQPEINIDIYAEGVRNRTTYEIPGPPVWTGV